MRRSSLDGIAAYVSACGIAADPRAPIFMRRPHLPRMSAAAPEKHRLLALAGWGHGGKCGVATPFA